MTLTSGDYQFVRNLVRQHAAIVLDDDKSYLIDNRLNTLAHREGFKSLTDLVHALRQRAQGLHEKVIEALTTNETSFFRDQTPYEALRLIVLPEILERRTASKTLTIWSAAASTGQEPYSIAILLCEAFPQLVDWDVRILATDLSHDVLERARQGRYTSIEIQRGLSGEMSQKYFKRDGSDWQLTDEVRQMVEFMPVNLIGPWPTFGSVDILLMRNVLIYFDNETKRRLLQRAHRLLNPDGYLLLGGAESTLKLSEDFERLDYPRSGCHRVRSSS